MGLRGLPQGQGGLPSSRDGPRELSGTPQRTSPAPPRPAARPRREAVAAAVRVHNYEGGSRGSKKSKKTCILVYSRVDYKIINVHSGDVLSLRWRVGRREAVGAMQPRTCLSHPPTLCIYIGGGASTSDYLLSMYIVVFCLCMPLYISSVATRVTRRLLPITCLLKQTFATMATKPRPCLPHPEGDDPARLLTW